MSVLGRQSAPGYLIALFTDFILQFFLQYGIVFPSLKRSDSTYVDTS